MERNRKKNYYIIPLVVGIMFVNIMILQMGAVFTVIYDDGNANSTSLFWRTSQNKDFTGWNSVTSSIKNRSARLYTLKNLPMTTQYRIDFTNNSSVICIDGLKIYYGIIPLKYFNGEELYQYIASTGNIKNITAYDGRMHIRPQNEDPIVYFDSDFAQLVNRNIKRGYLFFCFFVDSFILACFWAFIRYRKRIHDYINMYDLKYRSKVVIILKCLICFSLIISAGLVVYSALYSEYGLHPDEGVSKAAVDYYLTHWLPPDMRSKAVENTFSVYGHSRLEESNIYYLLAGKVGHIFKSLGHCANYYRMLNVCLYFIMCAVVIKNIWKESWLAICSIATPQLCYIFSYATSDACDYFWSFLLIYQVVAKDSMLNMALKNNYGRKKYLSLSFCGILSAFIFMGKANYYIVLLLVFIIFLFKLIRSESAEKKRIMKDYAYILLVFSSVLVIRHSFDLYYYGLDRAKILAQVAEQNAEYQFRKSTPIEDRYSGLGLKERGVTLEELYDDYSFFIISYKSFFGVYGHMQFFSNNVYYLILGMAYALLILILIENVLIPFVKIGKIEYAFVMLIAPASVVLSIYHSWTGDFQPQGRYLLPMLMGIGYLVSKIQNRNLEIFSIILMAIISMIVPYGFYRYGVLILI